MFQKLTPIQQLALDCYRGKVTQYSQAEGEQILRNKMIEILGEMPKNPAKFRRRFNAKKDEFFELVEETITVAQNILAKEAFDSFCEFKNYELGQKPRYKVKDTKLFKVSKVATGITTLRGQKLHGEWAEAESFNMSVKAYEEWFDFITGKIDWKETVDTVVNSYNRDLADTIATTLFGTYDSLGTNMKDASNNADKSLDKIIPRVKGKSGKGVSIYGTATALEKIIGANSITDLEDARNFGYKKLYKGNKCIELPQAYDDETGEFTVPDDILLIIPDGSEKIIKSGYEGDLMIIENTDPTKRNDMLMEFQYLRMAHVTVLQAAVFGMVKITA